MHYDLAVRTSIVPSGTAVCFPVIDIESNCCLFACSDENEDEGGSEEDEGAIDTDVDEEPSDDLAMVEENEVTEELGSNSTDSDGEAGNEGMDLSDLKAAIGENRL
jgi:hypothetical protein